MAVTLKEVTRENLREVLALDVAPSQRKFVASVAVSIAQAHFYPESAWFRAVYDDETLVGFAMLSVKPDQPVLILRLIIDARFQGRGYGTAAVGLLTDAVKRIRPNDELLLVSHEPTEGHPGPFYERLGFEYTGETDSDGERILRLRIGGAVGDSNGVQ